MKHLRKTICLILSFLLSVTVLLGCSQKEVICPFTEITWENSTEDIFALEGEDYEDGDALYYGPSYKYNKEYRGLNGTIQYMFDENDKLACMAWLYASDSMEEIQTLYDTIHQELVDEYGKGGYESEFQSQITGDVWYLDGGNIILLISTVNEYKALQLSFVSPEHSLDEPK